MLNTAGASAAAAVGAAYFDATRAVAFDYTENAPNEPEEWRDAALATADLWLTSEEFRQIAEELSDVIRPYRRRARTEDTRRVRVMNVVVPHRRHPDPDSTK
jgi:hypothetical protein